MPCVPQLVRRTAAGVSAVLGLLLLATVIILALSLPRSAAYGAASPSGPQAGGGYDPESSDEAESDETSGATPGPTTPTEETPPTDQDHPNPSPSTRTQAPDPSGPSPTKAAPTHSTKARPKADKTTPAAKKTSATKPSSRSETRTAPAPAGVTVARQWDPRVLPAPDRGPAPGSVPRPNGRSAGEQEAAARLAAAEAAVPAPPQWPDQAFGMSLVAAGLISLTFSVGGIVVVALRRRQW